MEDTTWAERMEGDATLAAFVRAEVARAGIDAAAWRAEADHWRMVARRLREELERSRTDEDRVRRSNREGQAGRRRQRS